MAALENFFQGSHYENLNYTKSNNKKKIKKIKTSYIDETTTTKTKNKYINSYNFLLQVFLFRNCCIIVSLWILQTTSSKF